MQYRNGTISINNGSAVVNGVGTEWSARINAGALLAIPGHAGTYTVLSVESDTQLTLTTPWQGENVAAARYWITTDFTPFNNLPLAQPTDLDATKVIERAMLMIDQKLTPTPMGLFAVLDKDLTVPPLSPANGAAYIVPAGAIGAWAGKTSKIAIFQQGSWLFYTPSNAAWLKVQDEGKFYFYDLASNTWAINPMAAEASTKVSKSGDSMQGPLRLSGGAFNAPSLTFSGDTDTGIYRPAADTIGVAVGGSQALEIRKNGSVNETVVRGDLIVEGRQVIQNTTVVEIDDNILLLNKDVTGAPTENAGVEIERGAELNAQLLWDEGSDFWRAGVAGAMRPIAFTEEAPIADALPFWNAATRRFQTSSAIVTDGTDIFISGGRVLTTATLDISTKLDASAYTAADVLAKFKTVDGSGSGTDADLLDGQHGSYYLTYDNLTGAPLYYRGPTAAGIRGTETNTGAVRFYLFGDGDGNMGLLKPDGSDWVLRANTAGAWVNDSQVWTAANFDPSNIVRGGGGATLSGLRIEHANWPSLGIREGDGPADEKFCAWVADSGSLDFRLYNDAETAYSSAFSINRNGFGSPDWNFTANNFTVNGQAIIHAGNIGDYAAAGTWASISGKPAWIDSFDPATKATLGSFPTFSQLRTSYGAGGVAGTVYFGNGDKYLDFNGSNYSLVGGALYLSSPVFNLNNVNAAGPNFVSDTTNKDANDYGFVVRRSGQNYGGITNDGRGMFALGSAVGGNAIWHAGNFNPGAKLNVTDATQYVEGGRILTRTANGSGELRDLAVNRGNGTGVIYFGGTTGSATRYVYSDSVGFYFEGAPLFSNGYRVWDSQNFSPSNYVLKNDHATLSDVTVRRLFLQDNHTQSVLNPTFDQAGYFGAQTVTQGGILADRLAFTPPTTASWSTDGTNFTSIGVPTILFRGIIASQWGGFNIPVSIKKVRFTWSPLGYIFMDNFLAACSTNGSNVRFIFEKSADGTTWLPYYTSGWTSTWPGYITHKLAGTPGGEYQHFRITVERDQGSTNDVTLGSLVIMSSYGGSNPLYVWDENRNLTLQGSGQFYAGANKVWNAGDFVINQAAVPYTVAQRNSAGYISAAWFNCDNGGLFSATTGSHLKQDWQGWTAQSGSSGSSVLKLQTADGVTRGSFYADNSNRFGFLTGTGAWALVVNPGSSAMDYTSQSASESWIRVACSDGAIRGWFGAAVNGTAGILTPAGNWKLALPETGAPTIRVDGTPRGILHSAGGVGFDNARYGLIGAYNAADTQAIWAMGPAYQLPVGGASNNYGSHYGLAWSYNPDYGGAGNNPQSKAGLNHQLLIQMAGVTQTAIGTGIWTNGTLYAGGTGTFAGALNVTGVISGSNYAYATNFVASGWLRTSGSAGIHFDAYGRGILPADNGFSYGNFAIYGPGLNGWQGVGINGSNNCILMSNASTHGFYSPASGVWLAQWDTGGNWIFAGNVTAYSDERLKENKRPIDRITERRNGLAEAAILYERDGRTRFGYGAQTLRKSNPEAVHEAEDARKQIDGTGTLSVDYGETAAVLAVASKMTDDRVAQLENRCARLEAIILKLTGETL